MCTSGHVRVENNTGDLRAHKRRGSTYEFDPLGLAPVPQASPTLALVRDLVECVRRGGTPSANEVVSRYGMEILMGVAQSHLEQGRRVELPLDNRAMYIPSH